MEMTLNLPRDALAAFRGDLSRRLAKEVTRAMGQATAALKQDLRAQTVAAGLGSRMANTWRSELYPRGRDSLSPAGIVWSKAPLPMRAFAEGATIRGKHGGWLAIPTPAIANMRGFAKGNIFPKAGGGLEGVGARRSRITPASFIAQTGLRLRFVYRSSGRALLVADGIAARRRAGVRAHTARELGRGRESNFTLVAFVLVPLVRLGKRLDLEGATARAGARLQSELPQAIERAATATVTASTRGNLA